MEIQRCKDLARQSIYWPNLYKCTENVVLNCEVCLRFQSEIVEMPWFKLGCDLFKFKGKTYLLVID